MGRGFKSLPRYQLGPSLGAFMGTRDVESAHEPSTEAAMSEQSARATVEKFLEVLASGDADTIVPMFTDDAVIDMPGTDDFPWAGRWQGAAKMREYFTVMPAALEMHEHVINTWTVDGDRVAVTGTEAGSSRVSGKHYRAKWCWVFTVRDGKVALWDAYEDTQALGSCSPWR